MTRFTVFTNKELDEMESAFRSEGFTNFAEEVSAERRYREKAKNGTLQSAAASEDEIHAKIDDFGEICRLMMTYIGRNFDPHEAQILCLYDAIRKNKDWIKTLEGKNKIQFKMLIRSLLCSAIAEDYTEEQ